MAIQSALSCALFRIMMSISVVLKHGLDDTTIPGVLTPATGDFDPILLCILYSVAFTSVHHNLVKRSSTFSALVKQYMYVKLIKIKQSRVSFLSD